jgi:hypothetical protein
MPGLRAILAIQSKLMLPRWRGRTNEVELAWIRRRYSTPKVGSSPRNLHPVLNLPVQPSLVKNQRGWKAIDDGELEQRTLVTIYNEKAHAIS